MKRPQDFLFKFKKVINCIDIFFCWVLVVIVLCHCPQLPPVHSGLAILVWPPLPLCEARNTVIRGHTDTRDR